MRSRFKLSRLLYDIRVVSNGSTDTCNSYQDFEKYQDGKGAVIVKLDEAFYGCVESAVLWYKDLKATLEADEYRVRQNPCDLCVFNKVYKGEQVTVIFHVDDLLGACVLSEALEDLYEVLIKKI